MTIPVTRGKYFGMNCWHDELLGETHLGRQFRIRIWENKSGYTFTVLGEDEKIKFKRGIRNNLDGKTYHDVFEILRKEFDLEVVQ